MDDPWLRASPDWSRIGLHAQYLDRERLRFYILYSDFVLRLCVTILQSVCAVQF
jgi:hypothetical protein